MARSVGADPEGMTVRDFADLLAVLAIQDAGRAQPLGRRVVGLEAFAGEIGADRA